MSQSQSGDRRRRNLAPEFDLPPLLFDLLVEYIGPRRITRLSADQRAKVGRGVQGFASEIGELIAVAFATESSEEEPDDGKG